MTLHVPERCFFTRGVGVHTHKLQSFELALRKAGIANLNLVQVSSILPPFCKIISAEEGVKRLLPGQIVYTVMARLDSNEPGRLLSAAIGLAQPTDKGHYGYLSEHHAYGITEKKIGDHAEDLAASMLASTLGIDFDPDTAYDERREVFKISKQIVRTRHIAQSTRGNKDGKWTTVLAAAVFIPEE